MSSMSMTSLHRRVLEKVAPDFLNDLDSADILPHLLADEALSTDDVEKIKSKSTRKEGVSALLDILPRRGDGAYISLQSSLNKTDGSTHLYETMKNHEQWLLDELQRQLEQEEKDKPRNEESVDSISMMSDVEMGEAEKLDVKPLVGFIPDRSAERGRRPKNPTKVLKDPALLDLAQELGENWEMLALKLGISKAIIYQCKENNKYNNLSQITDMLYKWKCIEGKKATVSAMLEACKKIKVLSEDAYEFLYEL